MYAIIKTGGKQYKVTPECVLDVEKLELEAGQTVKFEEVLAIGDTVKVEIIKIGEKGIDLKLLEKIEG